MSINVAPAGEKAGEGAGERACMPVPHRASRVDLVERLWQAAEAQVSAHEARLKALPPEDLASEAHAKSLATLARTIKDLIELHAAALEAERASD
jgi:hypothetical protein